jgi:site-specific DNA recombinase
VTRAVIYTRVSTAEQVDNYSLDTQLRTCREYCEREDLEVDRVFREEGESAKTSDRPELQEMLSYCALNVKRREIGFVVVARVDRLARNSLDHGAIRLTLRGRDSTPRCT